MRNSWVIIVALLVTGSQLAAAPADVVQVVATRAGDGSYSFDVTVASDETGWDKYADRWQVLALDGTVLGTRELAHPHVEEQPFTRSLSGVVVPPGIREVRVRAHDSVEGWGGAEVTVNLP